MIDRVPDWVLFAGFVVCCWVPILFAWLVSQ